MKVVIEKIGDLLGVLLPFVMFIFICAAYLHQPPLDFSEPAEQTKKENKTKNPQPENFEYGKINFTLLCMF